MNTEQSGNQLYQKVVSFLRGMGCNTIGLDPKGDIVFLDFDDRKLICFSLESIGEAEISLCTLPRWGGSDLPPVVTDSYAIAISLIIHAIELERRLAELGLSYGITDSGDGYVKAGRKILLQE